MTETRWRRAVAAIAAIVCVIGSLIVAAQPPATSTSAIRVADGAACERPGWVSVWSMPPSDAAGTALPAGVTLRQLIFPSLAGTQVRVRFSNAMSPTPVVIGAAGIARQGRGAGIVPQSGSALRFSGRAGVTIPADGVVTSDPVSIKVARLQELAVSIYLTSADPTPSEHFMANQASYLALTGNHVTDTTGAAFTRRPMTSLASSTFSSQTLLTGLDVLPRASDGTVVALGDSITDGLLPHSAAVNVSWPDELARRLAARKVPLAVANAGISGNQLLAGGTPDGVSAPARFDADVLRQAGVRTVILFEGINDLRLGKPVADLEAADTMLIERAHAAGLRIVLATLTPAGSRGDGGETNTGTESRLVFNLWLRSQHLADGVIDFDAVVADPMTPTQLAPRFDGGDHLHLSPAGYTAMGDGVPLSLLLPAGCLTN